MGINGATRVRPPRARETVVTGTGTGATQQTMALRGFVRFRALTEDCYILFGPSGAAPTSSAADGWPLLVADGEVVWEITDSDTSFTVYAAATGSLEYCAA